MENKRLAQNLSSLVAALVRQPRQHSEIASPARQDCWAQQHQHRRIDAHDFLTVQHWTVLQYSMYHGEDIEHTHKQCM